MAVNEARSMNANLAAGLTDGSVKKIAPNWGGDDSDVYAAKTRNEQLPSYYDAVTYGQKDHVDEGAFRYTKLNQKPQPMEDWDSPISVNTVDLPLIP